MRDRASPPGSGSPTELPEPIFTPATKADEGHDENISFERMADIVGSEDAAALRDLSLAIYRNVAAYCASRGIIVADTKFEFGRVGDAITLIDEVLTPDSSRFWPADRYEPGRSQDSFDKQYVRDYLEQLTGTRRRPPRRFPSRWRGPPPPATARPWNGWSTARIRFASPRRPGDDRRSAARW